MPEYERFRRKQSGHRTKVSYLKAVARRGIKPTGGFKIKLVSAAQRDLDRLNDTQVNRIITSLHDIRSNPFPRKSKIKKIKGKKGDYYRLRVGKIRVFYFVENAEIAILRVLPKKDAEKYISRLA